jgi:hypothetical protein
MRTTAIFLSFLFLSVSVIAQEINLENNLNRNNLFSKHEMGFSVGAFPFVGLSERAYPWRFISFGPETRRMGHSFHIRDGTNYEKMYHLGSYALNYNYHLDLKNSWGGSFSWVGKHIDKHWIYTSRFGDNDTVIGNGWKHYFTLQINYRRTYFREDNISAYFGAHYGLTFCVRDRDILTKEPRVWTNGITTDLRTYFDHALHITALGVEIGQKNVFNIELGVGTLGVLRVGFKHKFQVKK